MQWSTIIILQPILCIIILRSCHSQQYEQDASVESTSESPPTTNENESDSEEFISMYSDGPDGNETLMPTDPNLVAFYLYPNSENNSYFEELIYRDRSSLEASSYNTSNPATIFIHGFISNSSSIFAQSMKNAHLLNEFPENIILVDWGKMSNPENYTYPDDSGPSYKDLASDLYYQAAVANVPRAAKRVAEFVSFLCAERFLSGPSAVHIIGFSLGAHVAGFTGKYYKKKSSTNLIQRITGCDPAGPLFQNEGPEKRLDSGDAFFVDVIHTNQGQLGIANSNTALGAADFNMNGGGPNQPGCPGPVQSGVPTDAMSGYCAHNRAWQFYIKSLTVEMQGCKCMSTVDMVLCRSMCTQKATFGRNCSTSARGNYYLEGVP